MHDIPWHRRIRLVVDFRPFWWRLRFIHLPHSRIIDFDIGPFLMYIVY